ncbi:hypothetical protein AAFF_G00122540 [Aldrovandia affinis]|uniref:Uncharacterized protein n=1 Tax=Aldrovandia affinis TaxID=143900 RepID=A0AAD7WAW9_9TELE|nr:hypothetical protein AAFF_G00122540 [Aldrovandia affinis]
MDRTFHFMHQVILKFKMDRDLIAFHNQELQRPLWQRTCFSLRDLIGFHNQGLQRPIWQITYFSSEFKMEDLRGRICVPFVLRIHVILTFKLQQERWSEKAEPVPEGLLGQHCRDLAAL